MVSGSEVRSLGAWLHAVAHNAAVAMLRRRAAWPECPHPDCGNRAGVPSPEPGRGQLQDLVRAVQSLPPRQRDAIVMRELEGRSYDEIGVRLGASDGAVRQLLNRARRSMRASLGALLPAAPLVRWALATDDGCGVVKAFTLAGGSALTAKLAGAAVISAVSVVTLLPPPYAPVGGGRDGRALGRGASAPAPAGSQPRAVTRVLAARSVAPGHLTVTAASSVLTPVGHASRPVRSGGLSLSWKGEAGSQSGTGVAGRPGGPGTGTEGLQPRDARAGWGASGAREPVVRSPSSGGGGRPGQQAGAYRPGVTSPGQRGADQSPMSVRQISSRAG
jgi:hypothetical protein